jgi:transcriptional regulator with XRE-family HTH domain
MSTKTRKSDPKFLRAYDREMLRSAFVSLFWAVITERRKKGGYTLIQLAKQLGTNKAEVSRWFRGQPNWTVGTIANIAHALNVDVRIEAVDRVSGEVFTPAGIRVFAAPSANPFTPNMVNMVTAGSPGAEAVTLTFRGPGGARLGAPPQTTAAA